MLFRGRPARCDAWIAAALLLLVAIAARAASFGNPVAQIDDQFYLLVADRMLHGAVPYVDVWDRKPIGLFLLYAPFAALGRFAVYGYQVAALFSVTGVAVLVWTMARRIAGAGAALIVAAISIVWLNLAGGDSGQAPVFYTLPVAGAAAILMAAGATAAARAGDLRRPGLWAMLLLGIALQMKYSVVFEGVFVGLMFVWTARRGGRAAPALACDAALWIATAALPTALAAATYWKLGHLPEWTFANMTSIALRRSEAAATSLSRALVMAAIVAPLVVPLAFRKRPDSAAARADLRIADLWSVSALAGVALFGTWFAHYALPLFAPLAVSAAPLGATRAGRAYLLALLLVGAGAGQYVIRRHAETHGDRRAFAAALAAIEGHRTCIFVYDGYTALYTASGSCLPTTRPFTSHLHSRNEVGAAGIDQVGEVHRIMAAQPDRVVTMEPAYREENLAVRRALYAVLRRDYVERYRDASPKRQLVIYQRRAAQADALSKD